MKSDNTETFADIDRQIGEFEELLKELTDSATSLMIAKALLTSIEPAPRDPEERRRGPAVLGPPRSEKEQQRYEKEQKRHKHIRDRYQAIVRHQDVLEQKYAGIYGDTEYVLSKYFPSENDIKELRDNVVSNLRTQIEEMEKEQDKQFKRSPRLALMFYEPPPSISCEQYIQASRQCISSLRNYRRKVEKFGIRSQQERISVQGGDIIMRDKHENKPTYSVGHISNSIVSGVALGESISIISNLNTSGQTGLAQALQTLTDAVLASKDLPADQKEDYVDAINQIGKEATKQKPNKITLKGMIDGLLGTLKAVPDVVQAVTAVMPLLDQLHP